MKWLSSSSRKFTGPTTYDVSHPSLKDSFCDIIMKMSISEETERAKSLQERPLPFFRSPIDRQQEAELIKSTSNLALSKTSTANVQRDVPSRVDSQVKREDSNFTCKQLPLHRPLDSRPVELFYDLFFVANLATYTEKNDITNMHGLSNYVGFFCVMWFTWAQVSLYDARFSRDSIMDRICHAAQFGVMTGFAFIAYSFDPTGQNPTFGTTGTVDGKALSFILMTSRLILTGQYLSTAYSLRHYQHAKTPLLLSATWSFLAAMILLGVSFKFGPQGAKDPNSIAYITWYIISVLETMLVLGTSIVWRSVSFKGTHVCERFNLLTLIVLGEGILSLARAITTVWGNTEFHPGLGVAVFSSTILLYSIYMLYFDTVAQEHFGSIRQQFWIFLHFPLHLALILFDEGIKSYVTWNTAIKQEQDWFAFFHQVPISSTVRSLSLAPTSFRFVGDMNTTEYFSSQHDALWKAYLDFTNPNITNTGTGVTEFVNTTELEGYAAKVANGTMLTTADVLSGVIGWYTTVANAIFENFDINGEYSMEAIESGIPNAQDVLNQANGVLNLYDTLFRYFYIGTSLTVLVILALWLLSKQSRNTIFDYVRFTVWVSVGLTICFLSLVDIGKQTWETQGESFVNSNWVLPTPMILLIFLLIVFHLPFGENRGRLADSSTEV